MALLHDLLVLIVFLGPIAMVAYTLRSKLGVAKPPDTEYGPARRDTLQPPPLWTFVVWLGSVAALIFLRVRAG